MSSCSLPHNPLYDIRSTNALRASETYSLLVFVLHVCGDRMLSSRFIVPQRTERTMLVIFACYLFFVMLTGTNWWNSLNKEVQNIADFPMT